MNSFMRGFLDELEKIGLDLRSARKMTQAIRGNRIRRNLVSVFNPQAPKSVASRGPQTVPRMSKTEMKRHLKAKGIPASAADVEVATQRLHGITRGRGRIFSKGEMSGSLKKVLGHGALKHPKHKEMANRIALGHEGSELRHLKRSKTKNANFYGHASPGVIVEESSMAASLPKSYGPVKRYLKHQRELEAGEIADKVRGVGGKPGFQYGKRYSRHARKRIAEVVERKRAEEAKS